MVSTEVLNFGKYKQGTAYRITELSLYPGTNIGSTNNELLATITAGKTAITPTDPDFNNEALIGVAQYRDNSNDANQNMPSSSVLNDTFYNYTKFNSYGSRYSRI